MNPFIHSFIHSAAQESGLEASGSKADLGVSSRSLPSTEKRQREPGRSP